MSLPSTHSSGAPDRKSETFAALFAAGQPPIRAASRSSTGAKLEKGI